MLSGCPVAGVQRMSAYIALWKERNAEEGARGRDLNQLRLAVLGAEENSLQCYWEVFLSHLTSLGMGYWLGQFYICLACLSRVMILAGELHLQDHGVALSFK